MKKILPLLCLICTGFVWSQEANNLNEALIVAQKEHKKVLLYFSGSDWCAPCIKFKKTIINDPLFQEFAKTNLVVVNADFPRLRKNKLSAEQEKANEMAAEAFNQEGVFPRIVVLDEHKKILKKWDGLPTETVDQFIKALQ